MSERLSEYFTHESSDYLGELEQLLTRPGTPDPEQMLRLASGVRGSARMADVDAIARIAEKLEAGMRAVADGSTPWSDELRGLALQTVVEMKELIRVLDRWGAAEDARVREALARWEHLSPDEEGEVVPIASLFYDDAGPHVVSEPPLPDGVVPIESLLLHGDAALRAALALRARVEEAAAVNAVSAELSALLSELFDLLRLASEDTVAAE
jgi:chemotaxis protein histidine kinase CheA